MRRLSLPFTEPISRALSRPFRRASTTNADSSPTTAEDSPNNESSSPPPPPSTSPLHHTTSALTRLTSPARNASTSTTSFSTIPSSTRPTDADLPLHTQDNLYAYQLTLSTPLLLSPIAFYTAHIVWELRDSERIYKTLQKKNIITSAGEIRTTAITRHFAHQFAFLSGFAQRRVIGVLFWWEEEVQRLRGLLEQEREIQAMIEGGEGEDEEVRKLVKTELRRVRMEVLKGPSQRVEGGQEREELPAYEE